MKNSNFIKLLKTLSPSELRQFKDYFHSPFFNKNKKVIKLGDYIFQHAPDFESEGLQKIAAFEWIYGNEKYDRFKLNNLLSYLLQLLFDFIAFEEYNQRPQQKVAYQLKALLRREMTSVAEQRVHRFRQLQNQMSFRDFEYYHLEYQLFENLDDLFLTKQRRGYDENLQLKNDHLDVYYVANKFRIALDMANRKGVVDAGYECHFLESLLKYYQQNFNDFQNIPTLKIYYSTLQMIENQAEEQHYFDLKALLERHADIFPIRELTSIYNYALNYCIKKINFGKGLFYKEILDLYKALLKRKALFRNGYLTQWTFRNIVTAGIRSKEFDWTEKFISNYQNRLLPEEQKNAVSFNLANLFFEKNDFAAALQQLQNVAFSDNFYQISAKTIQLKSYFELEETEAFYSLVTAFLKYLRRHRQLSDYHKELNMNFVKLAKKLFKLKQSTGILGNTTFEKKRKAFEEELEQAEKVVSKDWLKKVMEELE